MGEDLYKYINILDRLYLKQNQSEEKHSLVEFVK